MYTRGLSERIYLVRLIPLHPEMSLATIPTWAQVNDNTWVTLLLLEVSVGLADTSSINGRTPLDEASEMTHSLCACTCRLFPSTSPRTCLRVRKTLQDLPRSFDRRIFACPVHKGDEWYGKSDYSQNIAGFFF